MLILLEVTCSAKGKRPFADYNTDFTSFTVINPINNMKLYIVQSVRPGMIDSPDKGTTVQRDQYRKVNRFENINFLAHCGT